MKKPTTYKEWLIYIASFDFVCRCGTLARATWCEWDCCQPMSPGSISCPNCNFDTGKFTRKRETTLECWQRWKKYGDRRFKPKKKTS